MKFELLKRISRKMKLRQIKTILEQSCRRISALYVTGDKANENYAVLTPYMEFSKTLVQEQHLSRENISKRRIKLDLDALMKKYDIYRSKELEKVSLENKRDQVAHDIKELQKSKADTSALNAKKHEGVELRNALKKLKEELYPIEDDFIHSYLQLPNQLHRETPFEETKILYRQGLPTNKGTGNNVNHLNRKDLIDYRDPTCYYLMKEAARFEFDTPINCVRYFLENNFIQFLNPDFARTLLLEAAMIDLNRIDIVDEEDVKASKVNLLHLTGGGSIASFLGFIAKLTIFPTFLPLRFIASGREYILPSDEHSKGLYSAVQSTSVQVFVVAKDSSELDKEIEDALNLVINIFREFNTHFRIVYLPAPDLNGAESLRASIQMFSPYYNEYIEVGYLCNYSDYVSKRLLFNIRDGKSFKFPFIAAGPILNVTKTLGCLIENNSNLVVPFSKKDEKDNAVKNFKNLFS